MSEPDKPETPPPPAPGPPPPSAPGPPQYGAYPGSYPPPPPVPYSGFTPPPAGPKNGLGIAALVIAIIALVFCWSVAGGIILGLVAVILGFVGYGRVKRGEATNGGVAVAGIVLGFLAIIVSIAFIWIWFNVFEEAGGTDFMDCMMEAGQDPEAQQRCADEFTERFEDEFSVTLTPTP
jgi:hypothetical protein